MRQLFVIIGLILLINSSSADWLAYQHCRDRATWGPVTVNNGNCVPGYFSGSSDRLLVSCGSGAFSVFRCTSKDCVSGCNQIQHVTFENGKCSNSSTSLDGDTYKYFCSIEKPDFGRLVGKERFLSTAFFPANATGWCVTTPWRYEVRPEHECYPGTFNDNYQRAENYENYSAQIITYKDPVCQTYQGESDYLLDQCLKPDDGSAATHWSFQRSPPPKE